MYNRTPAGFNIRNGNCTNYGNLFVGVEPRWGSDIVCSGLQVTNIEPLWGSANLCCEHYLLYTNIEPRWGSSIMGVVFFTNIEPRWGSFTTPAGLTICWFGWFCYVLELRRSSTFYVGIVATYGNAVVGVEPLWGSEIMAGFQVTNSELLRSSANLCEASLFVIHK